MVTSQLFSNGLACDNMLSPASLKLPKPPAMMREYLYLTRTAGQHFLSYLGSLFHPKVFCIHCLFPGGRAIGANTESVGCPFVSSILPLRENRYKCFKGRSKKIYVGKICLLTNHPLYSYLLIYSMNLGSFYLFK